MILAVMQLVSDLIFAQIILIILDGLLVRYLWKYCPYLSRKLHVRFEGSKRT
jgi:hypothetical protein